MDATRIGMTLDGLRTLGNHVPAGIESKANNASVGDMSYAWHKFVQRRGENRNRRINAVWTPLGF
jgi:hypothetical protein